MELTRIAIFAATLFAIAFSSYSYSVNFNLRNTKTKITANAICIAVLGISMVAGQIAAGLTTPEFAQIGFLLLLSISAIRRLLEIQNIQETNITSVKSASLFLSSDAVVAGFGVGLGGINVFTVIIICTILHAVFIFFTITENQQRAPMPLLGAVLFVSLAVLV